jgi:H+/Cl- antiporter ClcA
MAIDKTRLLSVGRAVIVGLLAGVLVSAFRFGVEVSLDFWRNAYTMARQNPWWLVLIGMVLLIITILVGLIITPDPNVNGSGIPQVEGQLAGRLEMNAGSVLWRKFSAGILTIGSGAFLGREGPSIQLGAAVGQLYAEKRKFTPEQRRLMIATGSAAGLAAAFAAPVAGAMFVLEEVYRSFSLLVWLGTLSGAVAADLVAQNVFGLRPVLHMEMHDLPLHAYWMLVVLAVILGVLGFAYQKATLWSPNLFQVLRRVPRQFHFGLVAVGVMLIGFFMPNMLGGGNAIILDMSIEQPMLGTLAGIFLLRFVFSMVSFGSGVPGGIFLPILTLGAVIGALVSTVGTVIGIWPAVYFNDMLVLGMVGYFAAISKAPFTAIILIAEMVGSLDHLVPLALVVLISYLVDDVMGGAPIYESLLNRLMLPNQLAELTGNLTELRVMVSPAGGLDGREVRQISWPSAAIVSKIVRGSNSFVAKGDFILEVGDELVILVDAGHFGSVRASLEAINREES